MDDLNPPRWVASPDGTRIATRFLDGDGPVIVFLPGYGSDMAGTKALALADWAAGKGRALLRFDYRGCGESEGRFEEATLIQWRDDAIAAIQSVGSRPVLLVGSSMGGWIMLLAALAGGAHVSGLVGIAAAPDFTDWGFSDAEKLTVLRDGQIARASDYGPEPMVTTRAFWQSGEAHRVLNRALPIDVPIRLIHGQRDPDVPWQLSLRIAEQVRSDAVQVCLVKDGDHRLSRPADIALLLRTIEELLETA